MFLLIHFVFQCFLFMGFICLCFYMGKYFSCFPFFFFNLACLSFLLPVCFLKREKMKAKLEGWGERENLGGDEGGETMVRIYCMKIALFSIKN